MGKIVMPKNSAVLDEVEAVLKIYSEAGGWLSNDDYKTELKKLIGDDQYASSYTKKAQITSYFGFTEWEDISNVRSLRRITERGKQFYSNLQRKNHAGIIECLICSLEQVTFGRNNFGCPDSDSDIEPPVVFLRAAIDLGYLTYKEFAYTLWKLEDCGGNYTDLIKEIRAFRSTGSFELPDEAQKYTDAKPIMVLIRWGLLQEDEASGANKQIIIPKDIREKYEKRIRNLKIYNVDKNISIEEDSTVSETSPEWFREQAESLVLLDEEAERLYKEFQTYFAPEVLKGLEGKEMLDRLFYSDNRAEHNLCHTLEHDTRFQLFGGIKGGSSYKFGLFYSKDLNSWVTGSPKNVRKLSESQAIEYGATIRDELVAGAEVIANFGELKDLNDYADLYAQVFKVMPNLINKMWVSKYLHLLFPKVFPTFYNADWQNGVLKRIGIEPKEDSFIRMGQIALFVKECGISNVAFSKVIYQIKADALTDSDEQGTTQMPVEYNFDTAKGGAHNRVVYGTPGCGKSYYVQNTYLPQLGVSRDNMIRTTFYQDYTNTEFVGQIQPKVLPDKSVTYDFNPGPFTLALKRAIEQPTEAVALVIEELNRGNAASIFGDIFQLLDRDKNGKSRYEITNVNIQDYLNKCFAGQNLVFKSIRIPANLYIVATMNTSDQNVFTLDTAFKRRWQFEKIRNIFAPTHQYKGYFVPGMEDVTWEQLVNGINEFIISRPDDLSSEDKLIGVYFIEKDTLCEKAEECQDEVKKYRFAYKLFEYLWDDVAKFAHSEWFGTDIKSLDQLIDQYMEKGKQVLAYVLK